MKRVLKEYKLNFQVKGPVFIGNGNEIKKKEYLFLTPDTVGIIDINRFYSMLRKRHLRISLKNLCWEVKKPICAIGCFKTKFL